MTELKAQWRRFTATGLTPTHIDSHRHIQRNAKVYRPMVDLAWEQGIAMRRMGEEPVLGIRHPPTANRFILDEYFKGDGKERLLGYLASLSAGSCELMCHPGYVDPVLMRLSSWTTVREIELRVFSDPQVLKTIDRRNIHLINYRYFMKHKRSCGYQGTV